MSLRNLNLSKFYSGAVLLALASVFSVSSFAGSVILIIGDGMDDHQITIARNYLVGSRGKLLIDRLPLRSTAQVLTIDNDNPDKAIYVADSANSATSMATGVVTSIGRIGTSAGDDKDLVNIVELAHRQGLKTGIVSTASITDATPASFYAHISTRDCENPDMMVGTNPYFDMVIDCSPDLKSNGGLGSISEQLIDSGVHVALGGGMKHFTPLAEGSDQTVLELAKESGYQLVSNATELDGSGAGKLLGLFSPSTMPVMWRGQDDRAAEKPDPSFLNRIHSMLGSVTYPEPMDCESNPEYIDIPSISLMTQTALDRLTEEDERNFFLMVESASIDKQSHQRKACGSIGELKQLDESLAVAMKFAESHPDTLILVTADHGQAAQLVPERTLYSGIPVPVYTPGHVARINTSEGVIMAVNYATNDFVSEEHTGVNIPLLSNDVGQGSVPAMVTQPEIFDIIKSHLLK
ncbi:alkaline phosphatase [Porticoccaceae bacterium]|jgi:alkaline phosphatase|nr:alkaline phosphatase [Porticoccaceae bacterium]MDC0053109.1 alkaline phosphatase [Gammaproteobacteria bacterium]MDA8597896.1 alkaline phosphatase [Porticoccaceae bacterium]MDA8941336.1 alkaline phosphatase [Porticoccaceae bacterium]MDB2395851.1 alkaline phosphatase [Porticoccaceae bacterium]